jgi:hypothetical protein
MLGARLNITYSEMNLACLPPPLLNQQELSTIQISVSRQQTHGISTIPAVRAAVKRQPATPLLGTAKPSGAGQQPVWRAL